MLGVLVAILLLFIGYTRRAYGEQLASVTIQGINASYGVSICKTPNTCPYIPTNTPQIHTPKPQIKEIGSKTVQSTTPKISPRIIEPRANNDTMLLEEAGIPKDQRDAAHWIIMHEGGYNPCIINGGKVDCEYPLNPKNRKSYGVCQALPGNKMASAGNDWNTNPVTQLKWCNQYAQSRYGGWTKAKNAWISRATYNPVTKQYTNGWW